VLLDDIMHFEGAGSYVLIHLAGQQEIIKECNKLGDHEARLEGFDSFVRIHKSHIVNVNYIVRKDNLGHVVLDNGEEIPYTAQYEAALEAAMPNI